MGKLPTPCKITVAEAFSTAVTLFSENTNVEFLKEVSDYISVKDEEEILGFLLSLKAFDSVLKPEVIFKAWKNHNKRKEYFRIDMFRRSKSNENTRKNFREYTTELALMYPDEYDSVRTDLSKIYSKLRENEDAYSKILYDVLDTPNVESILLGIDNTKQDKKLFDLCVEFECDYQIYTISAFSLFRKCGYDFGEE